MQLPSSKLEKMKAWMVFRLDGSKLGAESFRLVAMGTKTDGMLSPELGYWVTPKVIP